MRYALVFGKNWKLSLAEILSYFQMEDTIWKFIDLSRKAFVIEVDFDVNKVINDLGGTLKIIEINRDFLWKRFQNQKFSNEETDKYISIYGKKTYISPVRKFFKKIPHDGILTNSKIVKKDLEENCIVIGLNRCYFGPTIAVADPYDYKERDEKRPYTDYLKISPSRARIMINLAHSKSNLLDPFCGVGTIAQEAILRDVKTVFCSDISQQAVSQCRANLKWAVRKYGKKTTIIAKKAEIRDLPFEGIQSCATEPDLGPALKNRPFKSDAKQILMVVKKHYDFLFRKFYYAAQKDARIVVIFPCFNAKTGKVFMRKNYHGFKILDLFQRIPNRYKKELKIKKINFILDEEREKGKTRNTIREFGVFRVLKK